tara:strand:+ start:296 stop:499 length:204 start_codon:yes stop_codon:yes gene_type:complete
VRSEGVIWAEGKLFLQVAKETGTCMMAREKLAYMSTVAGFYIDITEVSNNEFKLFMDATKHCLVAEI